MKAHERAIRTAAIPVALLITLSVALVGLLVASGGLQAGAASALGAACGITWWEWTGFRSRQGKAARLPRWAHHLYAETHGYFWTPCEICGKGFGGHQWNDDRMTRPTGPWSGTAAYCPTCASAIKIGSA